MLQLISTLATVFVVAAFLLSITILVMGDARR